MRKKLVIKCSICGKWNRVSANKLFIERRSPIEHQKVRVISMYEPSQPFKCERCGNVLAEPKELIEIVNKRENKRKMFNCVKCGIRFGSYPPDDIHDSATRNEKDYEDYIKVDGKCYYCGAINTIYWGKHKTLKFGIRYQNRI